MGGGLLESVGAEAADLGGGGGLGVEHVIARRSEPQEVARVSEADHLAASVGQHLVDDDGAFLDLEDMRARITFAEDVLAGIEPAQCSGFETRQARRDAAGRTGLSNGESGAIGGWMLQVGGDVVGQHVFISREMRCQDSVRGGTGSRTTVRNCSVWMFRYVL